VRMFVRVLVQMAGRRRSVGAHVVQRPNSLLSVGDRLQTVPSLMRVYKSAIVCRRHKGAQAVRLACRRKIESMVRAAVARLSAAAVLLAAAAATAYANPRSDALRAEASRHIYNLDRDEGIRTFRQAVAVDPEDAAAYRGLATGLWLSITLRRGT